MAEGGVGLVARSPLQDHLKSHAWNVGDERLVARGSVALIIRARGDRPTARMIEM